LRILKEIADKPDRGYWREFKGLKECLQAIDQRLGSLVRYFIEAFGDICEERKEAVYSYLQSSKWSAYLTNDNEQIRRQAYVAMTREILDLLIGAKEA